MSDRYWTPEQAEAHQRRVAESEARRKNSMTAGGRAYSRCMHPPEPSALVTIKPKPSHELEKDLQRAVELMLYARHYQRLTPNAFDMVLKWRHVVGFFGHWFESQRNAFMPDLLIIAYPNTRPPLFLELKVRDKWQKGQKQAITMGLWRVAWTVEDAQRIVEEWEASTGWKRE